MHTHHTLAALCLTAALFSPQAGAQVDNTAPTEAAGPSMAALPAPLLQRLRNALLTHPSVQASRFNLEARQAQREAARQQFFPTPSLNIEKADERSRLAINQETRILRLQQPLWAGGRLQAGVDRADAQIRIGQAESLRIQESVLDQMLQTASALQAISHRLDALRDSERKHQSLLVQVENRARQGYSPQSEVALARARWLAVQADLQTAQAEQRSQTARLRLLLGDESGALDAESPALYHDALTHLQIPRVVIDRQIADAMLVSPAHARLMAEVAVLEQDIEVERAGRLPQINLRVDQTHGDVSGTERRTLLSVNATLGAGLSIQRDIEGLQSQIEARQRDIDAATRDLTQALTALNQEIVNSLARTRLLGDSLQDTVTVMESFERQYLNGRRSWQEVFNAVREWSQTRIQRVDALQSAWLSCQRLQLRVRGVTDYLDPDPNAPSPFICGPTPPTDGNESHER